MSLIWETGTERQGIMQKNLLNCAVGCGPIKGILK